jgi:hypothetical protein
MSSPPRAPGSPATDGNAATVASEKDRLGQFLAKGPLYTRYTFPEGAPSIEQFPQTIQLFCAGTCQKDQTFECTHRYTGRGSSNDRGYAELVAYRCRNCQKTQQHYWYVWNDKGFWKVGQQPELVDMIEPKLEAALGNSKGLYKKALRSRSFGFGIGALSYLRRIIEDTTETLMDLLREEKWDEWNQAEKDEFEVARKTYQYSQKISYASGKILPPRVFASGRNSFAAMHDATSSGLHGKSEKDCIELFDQCNLIFTHSFRVLYQHKHDREEFEAQLPALKR